LEQERVKQSKTQLQAAKIVLQKTEQVEQDNKFLLFKKELAANELRAQIDVNTKRITECEEKLRDLQSQIEN
jgi:hypothetical protein